MHVLFARPVPRLGALAAALTLTAASTAADASLWGIRPSDAVRAPGVLHTLTLEPDFARIEALRAGDRIELDLGDVVRAATVTRSRTAGAGRVVVTGTMDAMPASSFLFAQYGTGLAGYVQLGEGGSYRIRGARDGSIQLEHVDPTGIPWCGSGAEAPDVAGPLGAGAPVVPRGDALLGACDDGSLIDVLVPFTSEARAAAGGLDNMRAEIDMMIANMNAALETAGVTTRARLVHAREFDSGIDDIGLGALTGFGDGQADGVHALREAYTADQVALVVSGGGGVANGLWNLDPESAAAAFCICGRDSMPFIVAHEVGHNLGCCHARGDGGGCPSGGGLLYPFSNGHRFTGDSGTLWRSVMAYSPGSWSAFYSNPAVLFDGVASGIPAGDPDSADNAKTINLAAPTVATWRCSDPACFDLDLPPDAPDCNGNDVPDLCEIARGEVEDVNDDGVPDTCQCIGDIDENGSVDVADLLEVLGAWGVCVDCGADLDGDDVVGVSDLLIVLARWGVCAP